MKVRPAPKVAASFYLSPEWRDLVKQLIAQRGRQCEDPAHDPSRPRDGIRIFGDHICELRDGGSPLDPRNVMLRCGSCHTKKTTETRAARYHAQGAPGTLAHPEDLQPSRIRLALVCGPPASGKSTYAKTNAMPGALIIDLDQIASSLSGQGTHDWDRRWLVPALGHRNKLLRSLAQATNEWPEAFFIVGEPQSAWRDWWQHKLAPSRVVVLATRPDICWARIASDPGRQSTRKSASEGVAIWWAEYKGRPDDEVIAA